MICLYGLQCPDTPVGCKREREKENRSQSRPVQTGCHVAEYSTDRVHTGLVQPDLVLT